MHANPMTPNLARPCFLFFACIHSGVAFRSGDAAGKGEEKEAASKGSPKDSTDVGAPATPASDTTDEGSEARPEPTSEKPIDVSSPKVSEPGSTSGSKEVSGIDQTDVEERGDRNEEASSKR